MKKTTLFLLGCIVALTTFAQVKVQEGPKLPNETSERLNRMIEGDNGFFYSYRIRSRGIGTSYIIEKIDQSSMRATFSTEVPITSDNKVIDVQYIGRQIYVFYTFYDGRNDMMSLIYRTISSEGKLSPKEEVLITKKTDNDDFVDFTISSNHSKSKFAVKTTYKASKIDQYKSDFALVNATSQKIEWTKTVYKLFRKADIAFFESNSSEVTTGFLGFILNDNDDLYYAYNEKLKTKNKKENSYDANVELLPAAKDIPISVPLKFNPEYLLCDVIFSINTQGNLIIAGFFKDIIERSGRDLVDVGVFNYQINITTGKIIGKAIKTFDNKTLAALDTNKKIARKMRYKADYIFSNGNDFYLVGEQYKLATVSSGGQYGGGSYKSYQYMDIIVAKINPAGEFEWVANSPLRNGISLNREHIYKHYFATITKKGVYLFYGEHEDNMKIRSKKNFEPEDLKYQKSIHGSNFIYATISPDGKVNHAIVFENKEYCFAPIQETNLDLAPPQEAEIFVNTKENELVIYTDDRGRGRYYNLTVE